MDQETLISHGLYEGRIRLYEKPSGDMVGMMSVKNPEGEHFIKLTVDDLYNLREMIEDYMNQPTPR
jgi:hypothetical protein